MLKKINEEEILKIANLSKLDLDKNKIDGFRESMSEIIDYISVINDVDISDVDKFFQVNDLFNVLREDINTSESDFSLDTSNFIDTEEGYIKVKKIL